jgi:hypothetical protein
VLPTAEQVARGYEFFARRHDLDPVCSVPRIEEALTLARRLATTTEDEPAAMFFAFVSVRVAFPGALLAMTWQLTINCASSNGHRVAATSDEVGGFVRQIGGAQMSWPDVRDWFALRRVPK